MNLTPSGGLTDFGAVILGLVLPATLVLTFAALRRAIKAREAMWYLLIVFLPPIGSLVTLFALDRCGHRRDSS